MTLTDGDLPEDVKLVDGVIVIECDRMLTLEEAERLKELAVRCWPDRKVAILGQGVRISHQDQLDRIEAKLDNLNKSREAARTYLAGTLAADLERTMAR